MDDLEELREENHRLTLRLENLKTSSRTESDYLRDELQLKEREHKEQIDKLISDLKSREAELQDRITTLNEDLNGSREEVERYREQIESLKTSLEHLKIRNNNEVVNNRRNNVPDIINHYEELKETMLEKEKQLSRAKDTISSQSERLRECNDVIDDQRGRILVLTEELDTKQGTILEQQERLRQMENERSEQIQKDQQKVLDICGDVKSRGNSLFSEVEERRVKVEDELRRLRSRVAKLASENIELQATVERGDSRHTAVSNQLLMLQKSEEQMIKEFRQLKTESLNLFDSYRDRMESIRNEYVKRLCDYKGNNLLDTDLEKLTEERDKLILTKISLERELFDCKKDLKFTKHTKTECETHLKILRIKLQEQNENKQRLSSSPKREPQLMTLDSEQESVEKASKTTCNTNNNGVSKSEEMAECKQQ